MILKGYGSGERSPKELSVWYLPSPKMIEAVNELVKGFFRWEFMDTV
ncbi:MAG: hypothetical protein K0Q50_1263 [Vampirovibrio sp.]|jgi:hypothetical protein|nr:hypothetical protein [Vampirovibrio sp.]